MYISIYLHLILLIACKKCLVLCHNCHAADFEAITLRYQAITQPSRAKRQGYRKSGSVTVHLVLPCNYYFLQSIVTVPALLRNTSETFELFLYLSYNASFISLYEAPV